MKIVGELIENHIPSIVFDFSGNWTKLIKLYEKSRLANEFLYFKLGSSFNVNLLHSELGEVDKSNPRYLNYFYDVYAMAFKTHQKNIDTLKEVVLKNRNMSLSSITLDIKNKQTWEKAQYDEILSFCFAPYHKHRPEKILSSCFKKKRIKMMVFLGVYNSSKHEY